MDTEGVFAVGVSGMGPALSPQGERIVNAKMEARNRMLDDLERRGLNVDALTHRHRACNQDCNQPASDAPAQSGLDTLAAAHARIQAQEHQFEHLRHLLAVQENKILLLREALEAARSETRETR